MHTDVQAVSQVNRSAHTVSKAPSAAGTILAEPMFGTADRAVNRRASLCISSGIACEFAVPCTLSESIDAVKLRLIWGADLKQVLVQCSCLTSRAG